MGNFCQSEQYVLNIQEQSSITRHFKIFSCEVNNGFSIYTTDNVEIYDDAIANIDSYYNDTNTYVKVFISVNDHIYTPRQLFLITRRTSLKLHIKFIFICKNKINNDFYVSYDAYEIPVINNYMYLNCGYDTDQILYLYGRMRPKNIPIILNEYTLLWDTDAIIGGTVPPEF